MKLIYVNSARYKIDICLSAWRKITNDIIVITGDKNKHTNLWEKVGYKIGYPFDRDHINQRLLEALKENPDLIFIVKGNTIKPSTLRTIRQKGIPVVSWSNDDMFATHNRSKWYTNGLKEYDLVVTQKSYNCDMNELPALGARQVLFQDKSYDPDLHKPCNDCSDEAYNYNVLFIGTYESERHKVMEYVAEKGIKIDIFGNGWKDKVASSNLICHEKPLYGEAFTKALSCSKISLNFLRKINRDLQTSRSIEIPACGGFMLSESSVEHKRLFEENKEAVYFDSKEELVEKIQYYLLHDQERKTIALAGQEKCRIADYSFQNRMREIVEVVNKKK